ncbi:hypothetical protein QTP88_016457 [Uroleucon formosanum]
MGKLTQVEDLSNELSKLVSTKCPTNAQDYSSIDECLQTEDVSLNIKDIINDGMSENESHDVEQEEDSTDGVDEEKITLKEALQLANRLKTFCLNKSGAVSLSLINLETQQRTKYDIIVRDLWALTINDVEYHVKLFAVCIRNVIDIISTMRNNHIRNSSDTTASSGNDHGFALILTFENRFSLCKINEITIIFMWYRTIKDTSLYF